jgi:hypothetical protein
MYKMLENRFLKIPKRGENFLFERIYDVLQPKFYRQINRRVISCLISDNSKNIYELIFIKHQI